jgi:ACS family hexuronate transporter-like MFS transporter
MHKVRNLRWRIAVLLSFAIGLNYLYKQGLPVVVSALQKSIPLTDRQYSELQFAFLLAYGIMSVGGGRLLDLVGTRVGYLALIVWWAIANMLQGLATGVLSLGAARFLLGLGEGGGFPGAAKAISEWFPEQERSLAFGIFNTGASVGALIAPPLIVGIVLWSNWRMAFLVTGVLGLLLALAWYRMYEPPGKHKRITPQEREYIETSLRSVRTERQSVVWVQLLGIRQVWGLCAAKFLTDAAWFFFIFWLPKYLADVRHLDIKEIGYYAWVPFAVSGAGSVAGGWLSGMLIRWGLSVDASRKTVLGIGVSLVPVSLLIPKSPLSLTILFFSIAMFGHQFWSSVLQTLVVDVFTTTAVGSVTGLLGAAGSLGGGLSNLLVGILLTAYHSYAIVFLIAGVLHPISFVIVLLVVRRIEPVALEQFQRMSLARIPSASTRGGS